MSEKQPYEPQEIAGTPPASTDWREMRHREREARRAERRGRYGGAGSLSGGGAWIGGAVLILIGVIFLLQNFGLFVLDNWWALFILIPAFGAFSSAWSQYQYAGGRLTSGARGSLIGGFFLTMLTAVFLFGLNWSLLWPGLLILGGVAILLNAVLPD